MIDPSPSFLVLLATLLDSIPPKLPIPDTLLLQLHAIFGPMLLSALQLVDKREVVRISLPSDRYVYQVSSSSGKNYTIHLSPPSPIPITIESLPPSTEPSAPLPKSSPDEPSVSDSQLKEESILLTPSPPPSRAFNPLLSSPSKSNHDYTPSPPPSPSPSAKAEIEEPISAALTPSSKEQIREERIMNLSNDLKHMYCPCAGWSYGCLAGEKTILCKHLLAIIIAHKTGKEFQAEVGLSGVAGLLGLS